MREGVSVQLWPEDRVRLEEIVADRNTTQKPVWRARIVLLTADGLGTLEIMRRTGQSKPTVWRWQKRFMEAGVVGLLRDKTRPPGRKPLSQAVIHQVLTQTTTEYRPMPPTGAPLSWLARSASASGRFSASGKRPI